MEYNPLESVIWYFTWPVLIIVAYRLALLAVKTTEQRNEEVSENKPENHS
jgi:hypothetical protein